MSISLTCIGANGGIGHEAVIAFAQSSPDYHVLLGSRSIEKGEAALAAIRAAHDSTLKADISVCQLDVTDVATIEATRDHIESSFGHLDILINNAGIGIYQPCETLTKFRTTFETNVFGQIMVTETMLPLIKKAQEGRIIYVSSDRGSITNCLDKTSKYYKKGGDAYMISKAALNMVAASQRVEYEDFGVKVCPFNPGWCVTNLTGEAGRKMREQHGAMDPRVPAKALVDVAEGRREGAWTFSGMVDVNGGFQPW